MALQEYMQPEKLSANTYRKLVCCHKALWYNYLFAICMCSLPLKDTVLFEVLLGIHYTCPQSTPHSIMVHLTQLGTTCQGQHSSHAQLRDSSA